MTDHPMIVAMAKAMAKEARAPVDIGWRMYVGHARAALTALLEPTSDMVEAGCTAIENAEITYSDDAPPFHNSIWQHEARDCLTAMIRTALTDTHAHRIINTGGE